MSSWGSGPFGIGPWGGGSSDLKLVREFQAQTGNSGEIVLTWKKPLGFNGAMEIIIARRKDAFPMELFNDDSLFSAKTNVSGFTDPVQIQIFTGTTIRGSNGVAGPKTLTDGSASFPTSPSLAGRILRDRQSHNFRIVSNTSTTLTLESGTPASGKYVVLADFPNSNNEAISGTSTTVGISLLEDTTKSFEEHALSDRILVDQNGDAFIIYDNTTTSVTVGGTPAAGDYTILKEFNDFISPSEKVLGQFQYIDNFLNKEQAAARLGTGLETEQFYYYTAFNHRTGLNVAQSTFALVDTQNSTQASALSIIDRDFQEILLSLWPNVFKLGDQTGDFNDLMAIFGFGLNEIYSNVNVFNLTDANKIYQSIMPYKARELGLPTMDNQLGTDTLRRVVASMLPTWRKKGSKIGIVDFIRIITTWDVTNGTKDASSIVDSVSSNLLLRFYSDTLGTDNTRLFGFEVAYANDPFVSYTYTSGTGIIQYSADIDLSQVAVNDTFEDGAGVIFNITGVNPSLNQITLTTGLTVNNSQNGNVYKKTPIKGAGRFFSTLSGIIIPGFFDFREFIVQAKDVAMFVGESTDIEITGNITTMTDSTANFGGTNNLIGNYLLPKQGQVNDIFIIVANTTTSISVRGIAKDINPVGEYAVLSPLNTVRFQKINTLIEEYAPSFARMGLQFI